VLHCVASGRCCHLAAYLSSGSRLARAEAVRRRQADTEHGGNAAWAAGNTKASVPDAAAAPVAQIERHVDTRQCGIAFGVAIGARVRCTCLVGGRAGDRRVGVCRRRGI